MNEKQKKKKATPATSGAKAMPSGGTLVVDDLDSMVLAVGDIDEDIGGHISGTCLTDIDEDVEGQAYHPGDQAAGEATAVSGEAAADDARCRVRLEDDVQAKQQLMMPYNEEEDESSDEDTSFWTLEDFEKESYDLRKRKAELDTVKAKREEKRVETFIQLCKVRRQKQEHDELKEQQRQQDAGTQDAGTHRSKEEFEKAEKQQWNGLYIERMRRRNKVLKMDIKQEELLQKEEQEEAELAEADTEVELAELKLAMTDDLD